MHIEVVAFGRRFISIFQFDKLVEGEPEAVEEDGPAHYIPTPMEVRTEPLGYHLTNRLGEFSREIE